MSAGKILICATNGTKLLDGRPTGCWWVLAGSDAPASTAASALAALSPACVAASWKGAKTVRHPHRRRRSTVLPFPCVQG